MHREIKDVLDDYSQNHEMKCKLLTGRRVTLVEELSKLFYTFLFLYFLTNIINSLTTSVYIVKSIK